MWFPYSGLNQGLADVFIPAAYGLHVSQDNYEWDLTFVGDSVMSWRQSIEHPCSWLLSSELWVPSRSLLVKWRCFHKWGPFYQTFSFFFGGRVEAQCVGVYLHFTSAFPFRSQEWFLQKLWRRLDCTLADWEKWRNCIILSQQNSCAVCLTKLQGWLFLFCLLSEGHSSSRTGCWGHQRGACFFTTSVFFFIIYAYTYVCVHIHMSVYMHVETRNQYQLSSLQSLSAMFWDTVSSWTHSSSQ